MIHLEKLTYENFDDVLELKVKEAQYPFVRSEERTSELQSRE